MPTNIPNQPPSKREFAKKWSKAKQKEGMHKSAPFLDLGYQLAATFAVCILGGYFADKYFQSRPTWLLVGVGLAVLSTIVHIYKVIRFLDDTENRSKKTDSD